MRLVVIETGSNGRSTVAHDGPPAQFVRLGSAEGMPLGTRNEALHAEPAEVDPGEALIAQLWPLDLIMPELALEIPPDGGRFDDLDMSAGTSRFTLTTFGPRLSTPMHQTGSLEYTIVVSGEIDLVLEEGRVHLTIGDAIVVPGVLHAWQTGTTSCSLAVVSLSIDEGSGGVVPDQ